MLTEGNVTKNGNRVPVQHYPDNLHLAGEKQCFGIQDDRVLTASFVRYKLSKVKIFFIRCRHLLLHVGTDPVLRAELPSICSRAEKIFDEERRGDDFPLGVDAQLGPTGVCVCVCVCVCFHLTDAVASPKYQIIWIRKVTLYCYDSSLAGVIPRTNNYSPKKIVFFYSGLSPRFTTAWYLSKDSIIPK